MMSVACFLGFLAAQFYFWTLFFDPNAAGHDPTQVMIVAGVFVLGFVFYYVMKLIRRSQGIDVTLAFKEIPIERIQRLASAGAGGALARSAPFAAPSVAA